MDLEFKFTPTKESEFVKDLMDLVSRYTTNPEDITLVKTTTEEISCLTIKDFLYFEHLLITGGNRPEGRFNLMKRIMELVFEKYEYPDCLIINPGQQSDFPDFYRHELIVYDIELAFDELDKLGFKLDSDEPKFIFLDNCIDLFVHDPERFVQSIRRIIQNIGNTKLFMSSGNENSVTVIPKIIEMFNYRAVFYTIPEESEKIIGNREASMLMNNDTDFMLYKEGQTISYQKELY